MIALQSDVRVYLACGYTDMRKGMQGLAMLVQQMLAEDPFICVGREYVAVPALTPAIRQQLCVLPTHNLRRFAGSRSNGAMELPTECALTASSATERRHR